MAGIATPIVTVKLVPDQSEASLNTRRILLVGTIAKDKNTLFDADEKAIHLSVSERSSYEKYNLDDMRRMIGEGDTLERFTMLQAASQNESCSIPIDLLLVKNEVADAAEGTTITIESVPVITCDISAFIYNKSKYHVTVKYTSGQTPDELAAALADAFSAIDKKPFDVTASGAVLTVKYKDGLCLGYIPIHIVCADRNLKTSINVTETLPTQPQNDLFDIIEDTRYTQILFPSYFQSKLNTLDNLLQDRFNVSNDVMDGRGFIGFAGDLVTCLDQFSTFNSQHIAPICSPLLNQKNFAGCGNFTTDDIYASFLAGAIARMQTEGADVTDLISNAPGLRDYAGGKQMASLPLHNMPVTHAVPTNQKLYWKHGEQRQLNDVGYCTWGTNTAGNAVISGDCRTLWKTDAAGNENRTWSQLESIETSSIVRELTASWLRVTCSKVRITEGDLVPGLSMINVDELLEKYVIFYDSLADLGLVVKGSRAIELLRKNTRFTSVPGKTFVRMSSINTIVTHVGEVDYTLQITQELK